KGTFRRVVGSAKLLVVGRLVGKLRGGGTLRGISDRVGGDAADEERAPLIIGERDVEELDHREHADSVLEEGATYQKRRDLDQVATRRRSPVILVLRKRNARSVQLHERRLSFPHPDDRCRIVVQVAG